MSTPVDILTLTLIANVLALAALLLAILALWGVRHVADDVRAQRACADDAVDDGHAPPQPAPADVAGDDHATERMLL